MNGKEQAAPVWQGVFKSWEEVKPQGDAFRSKRWLQQIAKQLIDYQSSEFNRRVRVPPRPTDLPLLCSIVRPKSILDFGGSSGWVAEHIIDCVSDITIVIAKLEDFVPFWDILCLLECDAVLNIPDPISGDVFLSYHLEVLARLWQSCHSSYRQSLFTLDL